MASAASASASSGLPSSSRAKTAARAARKACSGESGCPSSSRRARWSQPLATPSSPRKAALSQAIQTARRAADTTVAAAAVGAIGALARIEHDVREVEPPRRQAETFERFRRFLDRQRPFEGVLRLLPGARLEGHPTGGQIVDRLRRRHCRNYSEVMEPPGTAETAASRRKPPAPDPRDDAAVRSVAGEKPSWARSGFCASSRG